MVSSDRPGSGQPLTPSIASSLAASAAPRGGGASASASPPVTQRASLALGGCVLEIAASPGRAGVGVSSDGSHTSYVVHGVALAAWAEHAMQLLRLEPARNAGACAAYRTPFLLDAEERPTIALGAEVAERGVAFALHTTAPGGPAGSTAGTRVHGLAEGEADALVEAARGAAAVARAVLPGEAARGGG